MLGTECRDHQHLNDRRGDEVLRGQSAGATTIAMTKDHVQMLGVAHRSGWLLVKLPTVARRMRAKANVAMAEMNNETTRF